MAKTIRAEVMRIWLDGQALQSASRYRGIGRYVLELLRAMAKADPSIELLISFNLAMTDTVASARQLVSGLVDVSNIHTFHAMTTTGASDSTQKKERQFSEILLAHHVAMLNPDIAICPSPFEGSHEPCVPLTSKHGHHFPLIGIFHDAIPIRYADRYLTSPELLDYYLNRLDAHKNFDWTLTNSDFSRQELHDLVGSLPSTAVYAGVSSHFTESVNIEATTAKQTHKNLIDKPYILSVGGLDWRKNVELIIEAFSQLDGSLDTLHLVVAGQSPDSDKTKISNLWTAQGLNPKRLIMTGQIDDATLRQLYQHAACLVQPSLMEGFGLTVLEAISCGTPVMAANTGALPEVLGTKTGLFDPKDAGQLADMLTEFFDNSEFGQNLLKSGQAQLPKFTWAKTAQRSLAVFRDIRAETPAKAFNPDQTQAITAKAVKAFEFDTQLIAEALAFATPPTPRDPKVFWDVSSTAKSDAGTGIQRVVNKIAENVQNHPNHTLLASIKYDGSFAGFFDVDRKTDRYARREKNIIELNGLDTIIMLDSSWDLIEYHQPELERMKLFGGKIYTVLYDLVPLRTPGFCDPGIPRIFCEWLEAALQYSDGFICISKAVADELAILVKGIGHNQPLKIGYWHLGSDFTHAKKNKPAAQLAKLSAGQKSDGPHFLMVGTLEPRKGHKVALDALKIARDQGFKGRLTIVGRQGWNIAGVIREIRIQEKLHADIVWINDADDAQLTQLYMNCDAVICASFAEGFGLPIVEAKAYGRPIIASDIDVFREVSDMSDITLFPAGDSAALADAFMAFTPTAASSAPVPSKTLSWAQSSDRLVEIIEQDDWYIEYKPDKDAINLGSKRENLRMAAKLPAVPHRLWLLQKPVLEQNDKYLLLIGLEIDGKTPLSGFGENGDKVDGIELGLRRVTQDGLQETHPPMRQIIPYAIVTGLTYHFSLSLDRHAWESGDEFAIELLQNGGKWWGDPLLIRRETD